MSRKVLLTIALLAACLACSCSWGYGRLIIYDDGPTKADARLEQILEALENEDRDALREMFSKNARDEASDFDESMDCLFKYFTGNIESWERTGSGGSTSSHLGDRSVLQRSYYNVATDEAEYRFFTVEYLENTIEPDSLGLYTLRVISAKDEAKQSANSRNMNKAGICIPEYK